MHSEDLVCIKDNVKKFQHVLEVQKLVFITPSSAHEAHFFHFFHQQQRNPCHEHCKNTPPRIPKKLGKNAIISALLKTVHPTNFWKSDEVGWKNCYHGCCLKFKVDKLFMNSAGKPELWLLCSNYPGKSFHALVGAIKLMKAGPPNQFFSGDVAATQRRRVHPPSSDFFEEEQEEDIKPVEDATVGTNANGGDNDIPMEGTATDDGPSTVGDWKWSAFKDNISINARGPVEKTNPSIKHINSKDLKLWMPIEFFNFFTPWTYFEIHMVPATSDALRDANKKIMLLPEIKKLFGIWFLMILNPQYSMNEFFETNKKWA